MTTHSRHPEIFLAFRFHANFYDSYRGDTPDETGFGEDIRIIRKIIEGLDRFNADGVPVRGTWDIENYFSLETIMPEHCPDIIESLQRRVAEGKDEVQVMSYNNGDREGSDSKGDAGKDLGASVGGPDTFHQANQQAPRPRLRHHLALCEGTQSHLLGGPRLDSIVIPHEGPGIHQLEGDLSDGRGPRDP